VVQGLEEVDSSASAKIALTAIKADMDNRADTIGADKRIGYIKLCIASHGKLHKKALSELAEVEQSGMGRGLEKIAEGKYGSSGLQFPYLNIGESVA